MGQMTRSQIVFEGMQMAGRDDIALRCNVWLQTWLDSVANSWPWPLNLRENLVVPVTAGTPAVLVGNGAGGVTEKILRVIDNVFVFTSTYTNRCRVRLVDFVSAPAGIYNQTTVIGIPTQARLSQPSGFGKWQLMLQPTPDKAYLMALDYLTLPAPLAAETDVPWYPNDITMIQFITARCMFYDNGPSAAYSAAIGEVTDSLRADRVRYGSAPGMNDSLHLDAAVFQ